MLARVAVAIVLVGAIFVCAPSIFAASLPQSILRDFVASAKTTISITITLADGQTIVVPVTVIFGLQNDSTWGGKASVDAEVVQQPGMTIAVERSGYIDASIVAYNAAPVGGATQPVVIVATPTVAPPTVMAVVIAPTPTLIPQPTNTPSILLFELETVGQWMAANEDMKRGNTLLWSQRLFAEGTITVSAEWYANELFDCVDIAVEAAYETFGASYSILDIAAVCVVTMGTP